jgi:hypothetical protein
MKVLLTLFPTHLRSFIGTSGIIAAGLITEKVITQHLGDFTNNFFVFMDMQASVISSGFSRKLVKHSIPGREGQVLQDMGGESTNIRISGKWIYENEPNDVINTIFRKIPFISQLMGVSIGWNWLRVETIKSLARLAMPMMLASDLFVGPVIIEQVGFKEIGGEPNVFIYDITLCEWNPLLSIGGTIATLLVDASIFAAGHGGSTRGF